MTESSFVRLIHADWSTTPGKRWAVEARKTAAGWLVQAPRLVGPIEWFVDDLLKGPQPTLAGFDFPIGVPATFGRKTKFGSFNEAIQQFGTGEWSRFYEVADQANEISVYRPFYPRVSSSSTRQLHLLAALEAEDMHALRRQCEKATSERRAACSIFWTLGGNQVGKAAISGWREIVQPCRQGGALLWPFEGNLSLLADKGKLVICETYPAEAYGHVGIRFRTTGSKQRQDDRREATSKLPLHCETHGICLSDEMKEALAAGFGPRKSGEDPFDAAAGLLGMIEVVDGRRVAMPPVTDAPEWEGWILGQVS